MRLVDLTQVISENMPVFPGTQPPTLRLANTVEEHGFKEHLLTMYSHTGTHIDAPSHMEMSGKNLDELPIEQFYGPALMIDVRDITTDRIELEAVKSYENILKEVDFVIFRTGWEEYWGRQAYYGAFPTPTVEVAEYLIQFNLKGVGIDAISIDPIDDFDFPVHHVILGKGMLSIENLSNLASVETDRFDLSIFPMKNVNADGSPVRAVAFIK